MTNDHKINNNTKNNNNDHKYNDYDHSNIDKSNNKMRQKDDMIIDQVENDSIVK